MNLLPKVLSPRIFCLHRIPNLSSFAFFLSLGFAFEESQSCICFCLQSKQLYGLWTMHSVKCPFLENCERHHKETRHFRSHRDIHLYEFCLKKFSHKWRYKLNNFVLDNPIPNMDQCTRYHVHIYSMPIWHENYIP